MNKIVNLYWTRHGLSCSNVITSYSLNKTNNKNYKYYKTELYKNINDYRHDSSLTNEGEKHSQNLAKNIMIEFDLIISSNLIRAIKTAKEFSNFLPYCNNRNIHISPYIQELKTVADGKSARTISELKNFLSINKITNSFLLRNHELYKIKSNIGKFRNLIRYMISNINKKNINILVISHGGFLSKNITNNTKIANLGIWRETLKFKNENLYKQKPVLYYNGVGIKRDKNYYLHPKNYGLSKIEYKKSVKQCLVNRFSF